MAQAGQPALWIDNMASTIKSRTFSSVQDNRIRLSNSNFARQWSASVGTSWSTIRIGCRISMENTGADLTSTPRFAFGISSGTTNIFQDTTTIHWTGVLTDAATWTKRTNNSVNVYSASTVKIAKRIGNTTTLGAIITSGVNSLLWDCTVASRSMYFVDIIKGSPNFSYKMFCYTTDNAFVSGPDVSVDTLIAQLPLTTPSHTNHSFLGTPTLAIDEATNGYFNAVNIAWDRTSPSIEISDLAVVKLA